MGAGGDGSRRAGRVRGWGAAGGPRGGGGGPGGLRALGRVGWAAAPGGAEGGAVGVAGLSGWWGFGRFGALGAAWDWSEAHKGARGTLRARAGLACQQC